MLPGWGVEQVVILVQESQQHNKFVIQFVHKTHGLSSHMFYIKVAGLSIARNELNRYLFATDIHNP